MVGVIQYWYHTLHLPYSVIVFDCIDYQYFLFLQSSCFLVFKMSDSDGSVSEFSDNDSEDFSRSKHDFEANSEAEEADVSRLGKFYPLLILVGEHNIFCHLVLDLIYYHIAQS